MNTLNKCSICLCNEELIEVYVGQQTVAPRLYFCPKCIKFYKDIGAIMESKKYVQYKFDIDENKLIPTDSYYINL